MAKGPSFVAGLTMLDWGHVLLPTRQGDENGSVNQTYDISQAILTLDCFSSATPMPAHLEHPLALQRRGGSDWLDQPQFPRSAAG
jgi:hypothetical protein